VEKHAKGDNQEAHIYARFLYFAVAKKQGYCYDLFPPKSPYNSDVRKI
jgi:hypothetical protein